MVHLQMLTRLRAQLVGLVPHLFEHASQEFHASQVFDVTNISIWGKNRLELDKLHNMIDRWLQVHGAEVNRN